MLLAEIRKQMGLTQVQLAEALNIRHPIYRFYPHNISLYYGVSKWYKSSKISFGIFSSNMSNYLKTEYKLIF